MLIGNFNTNYSNLNGHYHSGNPHGIYMFLNPRTMRGWYLGDHYTSDLRKDSFPTGTNPPSSLMMGDKGALLSSTTLVTSTSSLTGSIAQGINLESTIDGTSAFTANLSLIISLIATITSSGTLSGSISGLVQLAAALDGLGLLTAGINVSAFMNSTLSGTGTLTAGLRGTANLEANITPFTTLSPENLAASVWNSLASAYNSTGTMGEIMNNVGAGADPWSTILPGGYTADQAGAIVARLEELAKKIKAITSAQL